MKSFEEVGCLDFEVVGSNPAERKSLGSSSERTLSIRLGYVECIEKMAGNSGHVPLR